MESEARQIEKYLKAKYRVPDTILRQLRVAYADKSVRDSHEIKVNRIYSIACLALKKWGETKCMRLGVKRLTEYLQIFSDIYEDFYNSGQSWPELMKRLRDETGMIIRTGEEGDELCEYMEEDEQ